MKEQTEKAKAVLRREYGTDKVTETLAEKEERMKKKKETYSDEGKNTRGSILNRNEKLRQAME